MMFNSRWLITFCTVVFSSQLFAGESRIEDNSFLLEEAFNQEWGVYQFIQGYQYNKRAKTWDYTFENEIPVSDKVHQLSYEIPYSDTNFAGEERGLGDISISYRWQPLNKDGFLVADRFALIMPTGDYKKGKGNGVWGFEFMKAATLPIGENFMNHWNFGVTYLPNARFEHDYRHNLVNFTAGTSLIFNGNGYYNLMFETVSETAQSYAEDGEKSTETTLTINPGIRFAINLPDLQIVPGIGFPYEISSRPNEYGVFLYLSIEPKFY